MPPSKPPAISVTYDRLLFWVCRICAPAPGTEHPKIPSSEPVATSSVSDYDPLAGCSEAYLRMEARTPAGVSVGIGQYPKPSPLEGGQDPRRGVRGRGQDPRRGVRGRGQDPRRGVRGNNLNLPRSGSHRTGPHRSADFLTRCANHDGPILGSVDPDRERPGPPKGCPWEMSQEAVIARRRAGGSYSMASELLVLANFSPAYRLWMLAASEDGQLQAMGQRWRRSTFGHTHIELVAPTGTTPFLGACVCWQGGDGFVIGNEQRGQRIEDGGPTNSYKLHREPRRGLLLEPGAAVIVQGAEAVGVVGFVDGQPLGVFIPEAAGLIDGAEKNWAGGNLSAAILNRWVQRAR